MARLAGFPFTTLPISDDKDTRETVYKRTAENVRRLGSYGVPQNTLWDLLADFGRPRLLNRSGGVSRRFLPFKVLLHEPLHVALSILLR